MIEDSMALIPENYKALVIYNEGRHFSVGANIALALLGANVGEWNLIEELLQTGQRVFKAMKYAPFPVIVAPADMALGGGCEVTLHADAIQAHAETYIGQVEVAVGLVPAWGGCKELLIRWVFDTQRAGGMMVALGKVFEMIGTAQVSRSAEEARDMLILKRSDGITMNRDRLLADAKEKAIGLAQNYQPPQEEELRLPGRAAQTAMMMAVKALVLTGKATPYDQEIAEKLSVILSGGDTDISDPLTEEDILLLERQAFMALIHNLPTLERIDYMLETGKPLRN
jgi:3-hydroxyacyl-CoA dehydrogenase